MAFAFQSGAFRARSRSRRTLDRAAQDEHGSFDRFIWQFTGGKVLQNRRRSLRDVPAQTREAEAMSKELRRRGFRFVGPTICYAVMQAVGMVNDHLVSCFRHGELR